MRLSLSPVWGSWLAVEVFLLFLLAIILLFPPRQALLSSGKRRVLTGLRLAAWLLLALLCHLPAVLFTTSEPLPASLVLLVDQSQSMSVADEMGRRSRFEAVRDALDQSESVLKQLDEAYDLEAFSFDRGLYPSPVRDGKIELQSEPTGEETAIGAALEETFSSHAGKRLTGIVLLSDGSQRTRVARSGHQGTAASVRGQESLPMTTALRLKDAHIPIYTVRFGRPGNVASMQDVAITDFVCNDRVFCNNELVLTGQTRIFGYKDVDVPVILSVENDEGQMEEVDRLTLKSETEAEAIFPWRFVWQAKEPGQKKLTVSIPPMQGELLGTNNELGGFVTVVEGGLNILYVEGTRRFEQKYIRLSLDSSADIHVDYWRSPPDVTIRPEGKTEAERIALVAPTRGSLVPNCLVPGKYHAYIIGDMDATAWKPEELKALAQCVDAGSGLILLGGDRSFAAGGYGKTELADAVPFLLRDVDRVPPGITMAQFRESLPPGRDLLRDGPLVVLPEPGERHYLSTLELDAEKNQEHWRSLEPLDRVFMPGDLKPAARVVLWAQRGAESGPPELPLLVTSQYGAGRVAAFLTDSSWKWYTSGHDQEHKRFWRRLILWTAGLDEIPAGELAISLETMRVDKGASLEFSVAYRPKEGENLADFELTASVMAPDGTSRNVSLLEESGGYSGTYRDTELPGDYRIQAALVRKANGTEQAKAQSRFLVRERNMELDQPAATISVMENLAAVTEGQSVAPEQLKDLLSELLTKRSELSEVRQIRKTLYDTWPFFLLFAGLLCTEWFLRKRWGNVG
ncbi:MAG: hypothetical protein Q4G68_08680 [Planctomycetia bacterium]|nr:hypothetical protein [Planctomycetia bacterium]